MSSSSSRLFGELCAGLAHDLAAPLPGQEAQYKMAPQPRSGEREGRYQEPDENAREGGVLLLLYPHQGQIHLPLILRPTYNGVHSGQVALPGGKREEQDSDIIATALREAHEEVGIEPARVHVVGQLTPLYVFASRVLVQTVVGWTAEKPRFQTDPHEVARLLETDLRTLQDVENREWEQRTLSSHGRVADVPFFRVEGEAVWGATAMILSEFLALDSIQEQIR